MRSASRTTLRAARSASACALSSRLRAASLAWSSPASATAVRTCASASRASSASRCSPGSRCRPKDSYRRRKTSAGSLSRRRCVFVAASPLPHLDEDALHHRVLDEVRSSMDLQEPLNGPHGPLEVICELLCLRELVQVHKLGVSEGLVEIGELLALQVLYGDDVCGFGVARIPQFRANRLPSRATIGRRPLTIEL